MTKENKKPAKMLRVFNHKGQSIVEFALLCAFCVGVGLIVRETNLVEALGASFSGTGTHAAPTAIVAGETTHAGSETYTITKTINGAVPNKQNYTSGSEEANSLNFLKDLQDYYTNNPTGNAIEDDIWNAYKGTKTYTDEPKAKSAALALLGNNLTGNKAVADAVWKDLKKANDWAFDKDDATINKFLNDFFGTSGNVDENDPRIAELKKRNIFFANLSNQQIATMANNRNHKENFNYTGGDAVYEGYLAIKKQFWSTDASGNNTAMTVALDLAPVITDAAFAATSDEKKIFNYVNGVNGTKGVVPYFGQYASAQLSDIGARLQKELDVFKLNNPYAVDDANDDNDNLTTAMFSVTKIENVSDDYWIQIKKNIGWVRDADDNTIKNKLNEFVGQIKTDLEDTSLANDSDEVVEELVKRQAQFKVLGSDAAGKTTIKKMISNMTEDKLDADAYKGYLAVKKQFWAKGEDNITLAALSSAGGSGDLTTVTYSEAWTAKSIIDIYEQHGGISMTYDEMGKVRQELIDNYGITVDQWRFQTNQDFIQNIKDEKWKTDFEFAKTLKNAVGYHMNEKEAEIRTWVKALYDEQIAGVEEEVKTANPYYYDQGMVRKAFIEKNSSLFPSDFTENHLNHIVTYETYPSDYHKDILYQAYWLIRKDNGML